jgi:hypothetical protein
MTALREHGDQAMTTKSAKTTKSDGTTDGAADAAVASTDGVRPATGGTKAKPAKTPTKAQKARQRPAVADDAAKTERKARADTKQAKLIAMLAAKDGATVEEIAAAFGWQAHTVRGAIYGALKKKLGLVVTSEKVEGRGRVYRIGN